jgi:hypothetical protein
LARKLVSFVRNDGPNALLAVDNFFDASLGVDVDLMADIEARNRLPLEDRIDQISLLGGGPNRSALVPGADIESAAAVEI